MPDGTPANLIPETHSKCGAFLDASTGQNAGSVQIKLVDDVGLPIAGTTVAFAAVPRTAATFQNVSARTDNYGIATAEVIFGSAPGNLTINATAGRLSLQTPFSGFVRQPPTVTDGGVAGAGNSDSGKPVAVGSLIAINGSGISSFSDSTPFERLPLALDFVMASFDVPSANPPISVPAATWSRSARARSSRRCHGSCTDKLPPSSRLR